MIKIIFSFFIVVLLIISIIIVIVIGLISLEEIRNNNDYPVSEEEIIEKLFELENKENLTQKEKEILMLVQEDVRKMSF